MEGKNAYIKALENGSAESVARNKATEAVADYYAVKQQNLIAAWNTTVIVWNSSRATATNTTDVSTDYVTYETNNGLGDWGSGDDQVRYEQHGNVTLQLVNATSADVEALEFRMEDSGNSAFEWAHPQNQPAHNPHGGNRDVHGLVVRPPNDNYDQLKTVQFQDYITRWDEIESQNDEVQGQLDTFINNTYDSYQQGEINASDLIDPYLGAREYDPETSSTWNLRTLSSMGLNGPKNLSTVGVMNITTDGETVQGVLMSNEVPGVASSSTRRTTRAR